MCVCAHIVCKIPAANILPHDRRRAGPPWIPGRNLRTAPATFQYVYLVKGNAKLERKRHFEIGNAPRRGYDSLAVMAKYNVSFFPESFLLHIRCACAYPRSRGAREIVIWSVSRTSLQYARLLSWPAVHEYQSSRGKRLDMLCFRRLMELTLFFHNLINTQSKHFDIYFIRDFYGSYSSGYISIVPERLTR